MKKVSILLASFCMVLLLAACGNSADEATTEKYASKAMEVVELLNAGDFDVVVEQFDETMKANLTAKQLAEVQPILTESGAVKKVKKQSVQEKDGMKTAVLVIEHEKEQRIYTITYDANDKLAGLFIK